MTTYSGITVTPENSPASLTYVKIVNGVFEILTITAESSFKLLNVTVDAENEVLSGYDSDGSRYDFSKDGDLSITLKA